MTLQDDPSKTEVGVRELHDHLSRYVQEVRNGTEITVTIRGRRVARLVPIEDDDPLADLLLPRPDPRADLPTSSDRPHARHPHGTRV